LPADLAADHATDLLADGSTYCIANDGNSSADGSSYRAARRFARSATRCFADGLARHSADLFAGAFAEGLSHSGFLLFFRHDGVGRWMSMRGKKGKAAAG